ncbi:MAG: hypothetical protein AAF682_27300 [Planctomycetota bacterium]
MHRARTLPALLLSALPALACSSPGKEAAELFPPGDWVRVVGAVEHEGNQALGADQTLLDAVLLARPIAGADLSQVQLVRADSEEPFHVTVDVDRMLESGDSSFNLLLQSYDVVVVPVHPAYSAGRLEGAR